MYSSSSLVKMHESLTENIHSTQCTAGHKRQGTHMCMHACSCMQQWQPAYMQPVKAYDCVNTMCPSCPAQTAIHMGCMPPMCTGTIGTLCLKTSSIAIHTGVAAVNIRLHTAQASMAASMLFSASLSLVKIPCKTVQHSVKGPLQPLRQGLPLSAASSSCPLKMSIE